MFTLEAFGFDTAALTVDNVAVQRIAELCHVGNKLLCEHNGVMDQKEWNDLSGDEKNITADTVLFCLNNPDATAADLHDRWQGNKADAGWVWGEQKDSVNKTHPLMVPFDEMDVCDQNKDQLFLQLVTVLRSYLGV